MLPRFHCSEVSEWSRARTSRRLRPKAARAWRASEREYWRSSTHRRDRAGRAPRHLCPSARDRGRSSHDEDGGVFHHEHGVKAEDAKLLDVAKMADDLRGRPVRRAGAPGELGGASLADRPRELVSAAG